MEGDDAALGDGEDEFVFAGGGEGRELDPADFRAEAQDGVFLDHATVGGEQIGESWVRLFAVLGVCESLQLASARPTSAVGNLHPAILLRPSEFKCRQVLWVCDRCVLSVAAELPFFVELAMVVVFVRCSGCQVD